jgi:Fic family protein
MSSPIWSPCFNATPVIARGLVQIEAARTLVDSISLPPAGVAALRARARVRAAHYSTLIEGNRLILDLAEEVIADETVEIAGMESDVAEVRNYSKALLKAEDWAKMNLPLTETIISRFHRLAMTGRSSRPTPLRKKKSAIKNSLTGDVVYLPPRPEDLPELMAALEMWTELAWGSELPVPVNAGLVHYQLATIHPFNDGNGRTARMCADFILQRDGYGLNGFITPEEQYAEDLFGYYQALNVHPDIDYYEGRAEADLTPWLEYFISSLVKSGEAALREMAKYYASTPRKIAKSPASPRREGARGRGPLRKQ